MENINAAERLHDALQEYERRRHPQSQQVPVKVWKQVLGLKDDFETMLELQRMGSLVPGVVWWAENEGPERLRDSVKRHAPAWLAALSPGLTNPVQPGSYRLRGDALTPLASVASLMDAQKVTGALTARERQSALDQLRTLRDDIGKDADLPDDLRQAVLERLRDVEAALEIWGVGGDEALAAALERLAGVITLGVAQMRGADGAGKYPLIMKRLAAYVGGVYQAIAATVTLKEGAQLAMHAGETFGMLPPGTSQSLGP